MSKVQIVPNKEGQVISAYKSNPEYGYIQLQQTAVVCDGGWIREKKRSTIMRAEIGLLSRFVAANKALVLPGNIVVKEFLESEVPQDIQARFYNKNVSYEEQIAPYIKRAGQDGVELCQGGERILRFSFYDAAGQDTDTRVQHDNVTVAVAEDTEVSTETTAF